MARIANPDLGVTSAKIRNGSVIESPPLSIDTNAQNPALHSAIVCAHDSGRWCWSLNDSHIRIDRPSIMLQLGDSPWTLIGLVGWQVKWDRDLHQAWAMLQAEIKLLPQAPLQLPLLRCCSQASMNFKVNIRDDRISNVMPAMHLHALAHICLPTRQSH